MTGTKCMVNVRCMIRCDHTEVLNIEASSFDEPWQEEDLLHCLQQRNTIGFVAEYGEKVVGFEVHEMHKKRLHLINFAVHPAYRRMDVGGQMVRKLVSKLHFSKRYLLTLDVRETNLPAQLFFKAQKFDAVRVMRGHFEDTGEDAYRMVYRLSGD